MEDTGFGTDHERYLGSGIVQLSQIARYPHPDTFYHLSPECRNAQKKLEQQYRHEVCKPWLNEKHLRAEISRSVWESRTETGWRRLETKEFPCLRFRKEATICITRGIALLEIAWSSTAWGIAQTFGSLEPQDRWWVVDFFHDDGSHSNQAALNSQHRAVCGRLGAAAQQTGTIQLQYMHPLTPDLNQAAHLVRSTKGVPDAFRPLGQFPAIWTTKSFNYLNDIRKSWCNEESINYIQGIVSQWQEISLHWHPIVVRSIDPDSIHMLQSRAPQLSKIDHDYIVDTFERWKMLPQLTDKTLREAVKMAVCRQGPILTLTTFAEDVRLLLSRVHRALKPILGRMRRPRHDTLRKRVKSILEGEFDMLSQSGRLSKASMLQKEVLVDRCYQHVFLHTIRASLPEGSVSITQLRNLIKREIHRFHVEDIIPSLCNPNGDEKDIEINTPANISSSYAVSEDVDVMRRHGVSLFKCATASRLLYYDRIHTRDPPGLLLSHPLMAKHIVRIFLFGITSTFEADPLPPSSPTVSLDPFDAMLEDLPFRGRGSASLCTNDDRDSISALSSHTASESELDAASVLWRRPHIQTVSVRSQAGSIIGQKTSAVDTTHSTECTSKRPPPIFTINATQDRDFTFPSRPPKRRRSRNMSSYKSASSVPSVGVRSPGWTPRVSREDLWIESPFSSPYQQRISSVNHWRGSLEVGYSTVERSSPKTIITNSPSIYSPDSRPMTPQVRNSGISCRNEPIEAYTELLYHSNPFSNDEVTTMSETQVDQADPLREDNRSTSKSQIGLPYKSQTGRLAVDSLRIGAVAPRAARDSTTIIQKEADRPVKSGPRSILYKSSLKPGMFYRAPVDARSTERFVQSQKRIDPLSRFGYKLQDNNTMRYAATYEQLHQAIKRYGLETVFVISERLGSTEHPTAAVYTSSSLTRPRLL